MLKTLETLADALDELAKAIIAGKPDAATFQTTYGWNCPALTSAQTAEFASRISRSLRISKVTQLSAEEVTKVNQCIANIKAFQTNTLTYFFNGNATGAFPTFLALIDHVELVLEPILGWTRISDASLMPASLARRVERLSAAIEKHKADEQSIAEKIAIIQEASDSAEELPLTLKQLSDAQTQITKSLAQASEFIGKIDTLHKASQEAVGHINTQTKEADALAKQVSEAYRATTSVSLAAAFDARANALENTMNWWVGGLVLALITGGIVGFVRFDKLTAALSSSPTNSSNVWIELILTLAGLGLPLWFAWLSTKQIGQRFRLAEDYAYKASVAKAYEGYRREAARFDSAIEERLFKAALTRLEEEPLRYVEAATHGSPIQETGLVDLIKDTAKDIKDAVVEKMKLPSPGKDSGAD